MMIGWCYLTGAYLNKDAGNIDKEFLNLDQLDKLIQKTGNKDLESWKSLTRAELYLEQEKYKEAIEHLEKIVNNPGVEFLLRKKLTEFLLKALTKESVDTTGFESLLNECDKNSFLELKWEIYAGKGRIHELKGENDRAIESYLKAREIIESIASGLVEAYRDSYKQQRSRLAIIKRFMANKGANVDNNEQSITLNNEDEQIQNEQTTDFSKSFEKK